MNSLRLKHTHLHERFRHTKGKSVNRSYVPDETQMCPVFCRRGLLLNIVVEVAGPPTSASYAEDPWRIVLIAIENMKL